jgi:hypothetical protein
MKSMTKIIFCSVVFISIVHSQFLEDAARYSARGTGIGSRAGGMGNAYIGISDDYSASLWNPAGLAQMRRLEFSGGISNYGLTNDASFRGAKTSSSTSATGIDNIGFVFPFPTVRGSLVFAFGYNRVADYASSLKAEGYNNQSSIIPSLYDSDADYDIPFNVYLTNTTGYTSVQNNVNQKVTIKEGGSLGQWSFAGAIDVEENISFGIALNVFSGNFDYTRNYAEEDINNVYNNTQANLPRDSAYLRFNKFYLDNYLNSEISGAGFTFGMMYRTDNLRIGLIAKSPTALTIKESYSDAGESVFDNAGSWLNNSSPITQYSYKATNEYGVSSAWTFGAGASFYVIPQFLLAADIEHTDWTQIEWTDNPDLERGNVSLQSKFRAVTSYRIGAEADIPGTDLRLRGGYSLTPSPYKGDPASYDQVLYTAGIGMFLQRNVVIDGAIGIGSYKSFRNQYQFPGISNASRSDETIATTNVTVTLSYRF